MKHIKNPHNKKPGRLKRNERRGLGGLIIEHHGAIPNSDYLAKEPKGNKKTQLPPPDEEHNSEIFTPAENDAAIEAAHNQDLYRRNLRNR